MAVKKVVAKKRATKKSNTTPPKKVGKKLISSTNKARKTTNTDVKKNVAKKKTTKRTSKTATTSPVKKRTVSKTSGVNFREGTDAAVVWEYIQKGGSSRAEVQRQIADHFAGQTTRGGQPKPVSTVMNQVTRRALGTGEFEVESTWRIVPKGTSRIGVDSSATETTKPTTTKKRVVKRAKKRAVRAG